VNLYTRAQEAILIHSLTVRPNVYAQASCFGGVALYGALPSRCGIDSANGPGLDSSHAQCIARSWNL